MRMESSIGDDSVRVRLERWRPVLERLVTSQKQSKARLRYWWLSSVELGDPYKPHHHATSEALALLRLTQHVDPVLYQEQVVKIVQRAQQRDTARSHADPHAVVARVANSDVEIGLRLDVTSEKSLGPISERIFTVESSSAQFLEDYTCFHNASGIRLERGIPIQLRLHVRDGDAQQLASMLRQILQLVMAQQSVDAPQWGRNEDVDASGASRFYITNIRII